MNGLQSFYAWILRGIFFLVLCSFGTALPTRAYAYPGYFHVRVYLGFPFFGSYRSLRVQDLKSYPPANIASIQAISEMGERKRQEWLEARQEPATLIPNPTPQKPLPLPPEIKTTLRLELSPAAQEAFNVSTNAL